MTLYCAPGRLVLCIFRSYRLFFRLLKTLSVCECFVFCCSTSLPALETLLPLLAYNILGRATYYLGILKTNTFFILKVALPALLTCIHCKYAYEGAGPC